MNDNSSYIVPNWEGFSHIWKIVAIVLALLCLLLWLLGYGPGGRHCDNATVVAGANECAETAVGSSNSSDDSTDSASAPGSAAAVGAAAVAGSMAAGAETDANANAEGKARREQ